MEALIHINEKKMSDFEKVLWYREENKQLKEELKKLKGEINSLRTIRSSKQIRDELKSTKNEVARQKRAIMDLNKKLLKYENKIDLQELQKIYKQGDEVAFIYNDEVVYAMVKGVHKRFLTLYSFKNISDGFRLEYSNII